MRTRIEIDQDYTEVAKHYGDRLFKLSVLQAEVKALFEKMSELSKEPAHPVIETPIVEADSEVNNKIVEPKDEHFNQTSEPASTA